MGRGQQYAFEVDLDACSGCKACVVACTNLNGLPAGTSFRATGTLVGTPGPGQLPVLRTVTTACHHCVEPGCLEGCPANAYEKDPDTGVVRHLDDQCIGCSYCTLTCPYEVPRYDADRGIVRKCDLCHDRLADGEAPACVQACPTQAIAVRVVDVERTVTDAATPWAFPSPEPAITTPTTRYRTSEDLRTGVFAADHEALSPAHAHLPLSVMLVLTQMAVGIRGSASATCASSWRGSSSWSCRTSTRTPTRHSWPTWCSRPPGGARRRARSSNSERRIATIRPVSRAPGQALTDFRIVRLLAEAWDCGELFAGWDTPESVFHLLRELSRGRAFDISGIAGYDELDAAGGIQWPKPEPGRVDQERRLFTDGVFCHPDGRARFVVDDPRPPAEHVRPRRPLVLLTGRGSSSEWHTGTRTGRSAALRSLVPDDPYVEIAPADADARGIAPHAWVEVASERASVRARAFVTPTIPAGQVFLSMHHDITNQLTMPSFDPHSRQPAYKHAAVEVTPVRSAQH